MADVSAELFLYDTRWDLDREAAAGRVCPLSALPALSRQWAGEAVPVPGGTPFPFPRESLPALKAVLARNGQQGLPTQVACSLGLLTGPDPLLVATTWTELYLLLGARDSPGAAWADRPLRLHYHGFTGLVSPRRIPLFPPAFPAQPYPLAALLKQALASRRRPLPPQPRPFPLDAFWQDTLCPEILRGWTLHSLLPDRGVFAGDRRWEAPLSCRYPTSWVIEQRAPACAAAYTAFLGQKHPNWPDLFCHAVRDLPAGACRWVLVLDDFSPNPAESAVAGHCLCFAVEDKARSVTVTRDDDARAEFCQALESYNRDQKIPADGCLF